MALENFLINFLWKNCFQKGFLPKKRYEKIFQKRSQFFLTDSKVFYGDFKIFFSDSDSSAIEYWNEHYQHLFCRLLIYVKSLINMIQQVLIDFSAFSLIAINVVDKKGQIRQHPLLFIPSPLSRKICSPLLKLFSLLDLY